MRQITLIALLVFFSTTSAIAYFNPKFRQWTIEEISRAVSKVASFIKSDYSKKTAQVLISRGNALRAKKKYTEAEIAYQAAIEKFTVKENWHGLGNAHTELGILRTRTWNYKSAQKEFQKAIKYFGWAGDMNGRGYANVNLAQLYLNRRHFISAKKYFLSAKQNYMASNDQEGLGNVSLGLANLHIAKKHFSKAKTHFIEAEFRFRLIRDKRGLVNVYNSLSHAFKVLRTKRSRKEAAKYRQLAKAIELDTHSKILPKFSIEESFARLTEAFNRNRDFYEAELNSKAKQETERALR